MSGTMRERVDRICVENNAEYEKRVAAIKADYEKDRAKGAFQMIRVLVAVAVFVITGWVVISYFEAQAYNRVTGSDVSTIEAMFVQLRVQAAPK